MSILSYNRPYRVAAASVWSYNYLTETFGTEVQITCLQDFSLSNEQATDTKLDFGIPSDILSVPTNSTITITHKGFNTDELAVITGRTYYESGSPVERRIRRAHAGVAWPSFGLCVVLDLKGGSQVAVLFPNCTATAADDLEWSGTIEFMTTSAEIMTALLKLADGTTYDTWYEDQVDGTYTMPADFLAEIVALDGLAP